MINEWMVLYVTDHNRKSTEWNGTYDLDAKVRALKQIFNRQEVSCSGLVRMSQHFASVRNAGKPKLVIIKENSIKNRNYMPGNKTLCMNVLVMETIWKLNKI